MKPERRSPPHPGAPELDAIASRLRDDPVAAAHSAGRAHASVGRRREQPPPDLRLRIFTLGRTCVEGPDGSVAGGWLNQRPGRLLKYLVCASGRTATHDQIAEALWPQTGSAGPGMVRHVVHRLRERLAEIGPWVDGDVIVTLSSSYGLQPDSVWIDADALEASIRAAAAGYLGGEGAHIEQLFSHAVSLYRSDFMADEAYAEWAIWERERLRGLTEQALRALVELRLRRADLATAAAYQERLAELLPFDPDVHRRMMELLLERGRRSEAMRRYALFRAMMLREFGEEPDFSLGDLLRDLEDQSGA
jgi:DNA-binding SARP family transcriptional activator